jgi:hypothetical protein
MKFIHCVRDGRDTACSVLTRPWGPSTFAEAAVWWQQTVSLGIQFSEQYPGSCLEVRYEELLANSEQALPVIFFWLRQEDDTNNVLACYDDEKAPTLNQVPVQRWKSEMPPAEVTQFEVLAGPTLTHFGYSRHSGHKDTPTPWNKFTQN